MNIFEITLDVDKRDNRECVVLRQGDVLGTTINAKLRDHDVPMTEGSYTAFFCMTLPDRKTYYREDASYSDGIVSVVVDERVAAAVPGSTNNAYFELYDNEELKYTTASFMVRIKASAMYGKRVAESYDSRVERIMSDLRRAIELCVPPELSLEDITGGHSLTISTQNDSVSFDIMDGANGDKGDKGDKGDRGDPTLDDSVGMSQLTPEVRSRINYNRLIGTRSDVEPVTTDAYNARLLGGAFHGLSVQDGIPSKDSPKPITSANNVVLVVGGEPFVIDHGPLCSVGSLYDELSVDESGVVTLTQRIASVDLGSLSWAKTDTKTGGLSRYYTTDLNGVIRFSTSNSAIGALRCSSYNTVSYTNTYNRVTDNCIGVSSAGTVAVYDGDLAGSMSNVQMFTEAVTGVTLLYALAQPITTVVGTVELPVISGPVVTFSCNVPFSVSYERDLQRVISRLEERVGV